ncbi:MAG: dihydroxyacetone kinase subunit DhaK [Deltaproteobacteria bacterium]|nr:dihydroxyacetone kinase subunit DhaK [Deltaproteobacteria bacterium]
MKHFINAREDMVVEAIEAEVALSNGKLRRLDGFPAIKVVVRADWDRSAVAIVSGGGSGHEPAHVGFVGDGMLTAAVCGEIFASPSVDAVLAAILAVTGAPGCLLVVKNYTGDRLNFGLAAEKARAMGLAVEMVIVGDDVAIADAPRPRGVAGTLFVHKVAGHVARAGGSLAEVKAAAERVAGVVTSLGVSLTSCNIPGQVSENRIGHEQVELGLGIHGEPGAKLVPLAPVRELAAVMTDLLESARGGTSPIALLVNDLGGVPPIEMAIVTRGMLAASTREVRLVFGPARLMTSLDMKGFSVSVLGLDDSTIEAALLSPVGATAWPVARRPERVVPIALPEGVRVALPAASSHPERRRILEKICDALVAKQAELDALDAKVGDGDTGSTLATAARALRAELDAMPFADAPALCGAVSDRLSTVMGGTSGVLLAIFTAAVGARVGSAGWPAALREGLRRVQEYGGAQLGDRTMLDALDPAIVALETTNDLGAAARAAAEGAARTASMSRARAGRSSYVREDALAGVPDPGAVAVAALFEAIA